MAKSGSSSGALEAGTITARILVNKSWYNYNQEEKQELDPQQTSSDSSKVCQTLGEFRKP